MKEIKESKLKWDVDMSDEKFVELSLPYFKKKYLNLHIGCCLLAKTNPETMKNPIGQDHQDYTEDDVFDSFVFRAFGVALRSVNGEIPILNTHDVTKPIKNGMDVILDIRVFIAWALEKWPSFTHIEAAENAYRERKSKSPIANYLGKDKSKQQIKEEKRIQAFKELLEELGVKHFKLSMRQLAKKLAARIKDTDFSLSSESLRRKNRIPIWYKQYGLVGKN